MTAITMQNTMGMGLAIMNTTNSDISLDTAEVSKNEDKSLDSNVDISSVGDADIEGIGNEGKLKSVSRFNSTYMKPLMFFGGVATIGVLVFSAKVMTPEPEVRTVDGGEVNAIRVDPSIDGRDQLTTEQAKYLSQKDLMEAERKAKEGVSSAALINRAEVNSQGTFFEDTETTNLDAINKNYSGIPKTTAQLLAENKASGGTLYAVGVDSEGYTIFTNKETGSVIQPIDKVPYSEDGTVAPSNATYNYSSSNYNSGGGSNEMDVNPDGTYQSSVGMADERDREERQQAQQNYSSNNNDSDDVVDTAQQAPRIDPAIENKRLTLGADYEQYLAQNAELEAKEQELRQQQNARYQELTNHRYESANNALNQTINEIKASVGTVNSYTPVSYRPKNNGGQGGEGGQYGNGGYSSSSMGGASISLPPNGFNDKTDAVTVANRGEYQANDQYSIAGEGEQGEVIDRRLPKNIIRAGTKWQAVITNQVNSDDGLQVTAELVTGKLAGSTVYGVIRPSGRNVGVQWETIAPPNPRKPLIPIEAYATTLASNKTGISDDVTYHYGQNYGIKALTSIMKGYGEAYADSNQTVTYGPDGNVTSVTSGKPDSKEIRGEVLKELGDQLTQDIAKLGNRAPTYKVPMGKIVNIVLSSDFDINGTAQSINNSDAL